MPTDSFHLLIESLTGLVMLGGFVIGLMIKSSLGEIKLAQANNNATLLSAQVGMKEDLAEKHHQNTQGLAVHIAEDRQRFDSIGSTLAKMDLKLDRLTGTAVRR